MRRLFTVLVLFVSVVATAAEPADFEAANTAYAEGRFAAARDAYEEIVDRGEYSANLFYNLGNAWYRLENPGQAVLAYQRALALDPGHSGAHANLLRTQQSTGARVPAEPGWLQYYPTLGADGYVWILCVAFWSAILALTARLLGLLRRRLAYSAMAGALLLALATMPMLQRQIQNEKAAVVIVSETTARLAPTGSAAVSERLPAGSIARLHAVRGDWAYAELPDAQKLWIPAADLVPVRL